MDESVIWWVRNDLRLRDNPALAAAIESGRPVVPVFPWAPEEEGEWAPGGASRWWLHHALADLDRQLTEAGLKLVVRRAASTSLETLRELAKETSATAIYWNRRYEPSIIQRDSGIKKALREEGLEAKSFNAALLFEPREVENKSGKPFQVFTPFWKHCRGLGVAKPSEVDLAEVKAPAIWPDSIGVDELELLPKVGWDGGLSAQWEPTREAVESRLRGFLRAGAADYPERRDRPDFDGTSKLSPYLHFGQVGPRELLERFTRSKSYGPVVENGIVRQLYWREFAHHLLFHFPETPLKPLREEFELFPWKRDEAVLERWQRGETGYPIVDAGMRQLWETGWMHNRVRMIVASFLVKHLLHDWVDGARWFWDTLVDADLANNTLGWQWTAGCGADAAPYFRVFNPILQGKKFDPDGSYVKHWIPELEKLTASQVHTPWEVEGCGYVAPVVEHSAGRAGALAAFEELKARRLENA